MALTPLPGQGEQADEVAQTHRRHTEIVGEGGEKKQVITRDDTASLFLIQNPAFGEFSSKREVMEPRPGMISGHSAVIS